MVLSSIPGWLRPRILLQLGLCHRSHRSLANRQVAATRSGRCIRHRRRSHRSPRVTFGGKSHQNQWGTLNFAEARGLAAARSRRGSDSPPDCHSTPRRRFATPHPLCRLPGTGSVYDSTLRISGALRSASYLLPHSKITQ